MILGREMEVQWPKDVLHSLRQIVGISKTDLVMGKLNVIEEFHRNGCVLVEVVKIDNKIDDFKGTLSVLFQYNQIDQYNQLM